MDLSGCCTESPSIVFRFQVQVVLMTITILDTNNNNNNNKKYNNNNNNYVFVKFGCSVRVGGDRWRESRRVGGAARVSDDGAPAGSVSPRNANTTTTPVKPATRTRHRTRSPDAHRRRRRASSSTANFRRRRRRRRWPRTATAGQRTESCRRRNHPIPFSLFAAIVAVAPISRRRSFPQPRQTVGSQRENRPCYAGGQCRRPPAHASRRTSVARNVTVWWARPVGNPACYGMPIRRGHVTQRTTVIETIIRKFDTHSEYRSMGDLVSV